MMAQTKCYIAYNPDTLEFIFPYQIYLQIPEGIPVVEIDTSKGIPIQKYRLKKLETGEVIAEVPENTTKLDK
jgi:hypothetical protein